MELYNTDLKVFTNLIKALENLPISPRVLTETKIGRGVNSIWKDKVFNDEDLNKRTFNLV